MFEGMLGQFCLWVQAPLPACYIFGYSLDVVEFLLHKDGANLPLTETQLLQALNDPARWSKDADELFFSWSLSVGFTAVWLLRTSPVPTLLPPNCAWCGRLHSGGPEFCHEPTQTRFKF